MSLKSLIQPVMKERRKDSKVKTVLQTLIFMYSSKQDECFCPNSTICSKLATKEQVLESGKIMHACQSFTNNYDFPKI